MSTPVSKNPMSSPPMNSVVKVHLTKLFLWVQPARFQAWPELLLRLDPDATYPSTPAIAKAAFGFEANQAGDVKFDEVVFNLHGWAKNRSGEPILRGVGLLEKCNEGYALSESGRTLAELYRSNPATSEWKRYLAALLLNREPRTRVIMQLLVQPDAVLRFAKPHWFGGRYKEATLESSGVILQPFPPRSVKQSQLHDLIRSRARWSLGEWRNETEIQNASEVVFLGPGSGDFSLNDIGLALRGSLELFLSLGLISEAGGEVTWQAATAAQVLPSDLLADLGAPSPPKESPEQMVLGYIQELTGDNGFLVFSDLRQRAVSDGIPDPDKLVDEMIHHGAIALVAHDYGQPLHGEGLLGDPRKQLVKFAVHQNAVAT